MMQQLKADRSIQGDLLLGLVLAVGNFLLMRYVGHWIVITGGLGLLLCLGVVIFGLAGLARQRIFASDLLLVISLLNFNGWAFSHLSSLLVFLGLYFFALFGLIMSGALYRFLANFRSVNKGVLVTFGMFLVGSAWLGGLQLEASYFPHDTYAQCVQQLKRLPSGVTASQLREKILLDAQEHLVKNYGFSGLLGYVQFAFLGGQIDIQVPGRDEPFSYKLRQTKGKFGIRLVLSIVLLSFGVFSELKPFEKHASTELNLGVLPGMEPEVR